MTCPAPSCAKEIAPTSFACFHHWKALPSSLRRKINRNLDYFGPGQPHEHNLAVQAAKAQRIWSETASERDT